MKNYYNYIIHTTPEIFPELIGFLNILGFEAFWEKEEDQILEAYLIENLKNEALDTRFKALQAKYNFDYEENFVPYKNWNELWETDFDPIVVRDFCNIRADFHQKNNQVQFDLLINPKMAFGTGHHPTTYMMVDVMSELDFEQKNIFDYGCGTGVLAILASKLKAKRITALDIEQQSYENTVENATLNGCTNIETILGVLNQMKIDSFDIILANINRNTILNSLPKLNQNLKTDGYLMTSGYLEKDLDLMTEAFAKSGFKTIKTINKDGWICQLSKKNKNRCTFL